MSPKLHWSKTTLLFSGLAVWGLLLVSCISVDRTVVVPPHIPGAKYVGSKQCAQCHSNVTDHFAGSTHSRLALICFFSHWPKA